MGYIYCITNKLNGKKYVGKTTKTPQSRWREHILDSQKERCEKRPLYSAINKYGIDNFSIETVEEVPNELLSEREIYWISKLNTYGHFGYNATIGGDSKLLYNSNDIIQLANEGKTAVEISKIIGCCIDIVYNTLKQSHTKLRMSSSKIVQQFTIDGVYLREFWGSRNAQQWLIDNRITTNTNAKAHIKSCCEGKVKQAYNFLWRYKD